MEFAKDIEGRETREDIYLATSKSGINGVNLAIVFVIMKINDWEIEISEVKGHWNHLFVIIYYQILASPFKFSSKSCERFTVYFQKICLVVKY